MTRIKGLKDDQDLLIVSDQDFPVGEKFYFKDLYLRSQNLNQFLFLG
jgi:hypothetical protein